MDLGFVLWGVWELVGFQDVWARVRESGVRVHDGWWLEFGGLDRWFGGTRNPDFRGIFSMRRVGSTGIGGGRSQSSFVSLGYTMGAV